MATQINFKDGEQIVGYIDVDSGSLLVADGIVEGDLKIDSRNKLALDCNIDRTRIPIIAAQQGGRRFLLIPLDSAEPQSTPAERVLTEDPVEMTKDTPAESDNDK